MEELNNLIKEVVNPTTLQLDKLKKYYDILVEESKNIT